MSGPKMRAPKTTAWRESSALRVHERAKHHARRAGFNLDVILSASGKRDSVTGSVVASVSDVVQPEGRHRTLTDFRWPIADLSDRRNVDATVALAKRWCESTADDLSTSINTIARDFARRFRKQPANSPAPTTNSPVENGPRSGHSEAK